jgi:secreted trypsin-like serine protease
MKLSRLIVLSGLALALAGNALAMTRRDDRTDAQYLNYGAAFPAVGAVYANGSWNGSGTLIAGNWVLTAAHVADGMTSSGSVDFNGAQYSVAQIVKNPGWSGDLTAGNDLALLRLSSNVSGVTPIGLYSSNQTHLKDCTVVGFGGTGTGSSGWTGGYDVLRRAGTNVVDGSTSRNFSFNSLNFTNTLITDFDSPAGNTNSLAALGSSPNATNLEMNVIFGDSGGALLIDDGTGLKLAGVTSFIWNLSGGNWGVYGSASGFSAVFGHYNWIVNTVPEPTTLAAVGLGALVALRRRSRS